MYIGVLKCVSEENCCGGFFVFFFGFLGCTWVELVETDSLQWKAV